MDMDYVAHLRYDERFANQYVRDRTVAWHLVPSDVICMECFEDTGPDLYKHHEVVTIGEGLVGGTYSVFEPLPIDNLQWLEDVLQNQDRYFWRETPYKPHTWYRVLYKGAKLVALHLNGGLFNIIIPSEPNTVVLVEYSDVHLTINSKVLV